ncbi:MAG: desulfoferrodoxin [Treponema sp.]|nr:desulfoferrodoxin [Treponema sp.]
MVEETGVPTICCGEPMAEIVANTTDAAVEKHVPVIAQKGNVVEITVGSVEHPMLPEHYIEWILLQTDKGIQKKSLEPGQAPKADFALLPDEKVVAAYEYCNLHKLWKSN